MILLTQMGKTKNRKKEGNYMKKKMLYIIFAVVFTSASFLIGRNTSETNINPNTVIDYVPTSKGIILHTADSKGNIQAYILDIPIGVSEWKEKGYHGTED